MKIIISIIVIITISIFLFFEEKPNQNFEEPVKIEKEVIVKSIVKEEFQNKLRLSGFTEASRIVVIKSQVEGKVSSKFFEKGKPYKAGNQLILIDPEDKIAKLKEMEALLNQRKKNTKLLKIFLIKAFAQRLN